MTNCGNYLWYFEPQEKGKQLSKQREKDEQNKMNNKSKNLTSGKKKQIKKIIII